MRDLLPGPDDAVRIDPARCRVLQVEGDVELPGLRIRSAAAATGNLLVLEEGSGPARCAGVSLSFAGSDNLVYIGPNPGPGALYGDIRMESSGGRLLLGAGSVHQSALLQIVAWGPDLLLAWGDGSTSNGTLIEAAGEQRSVVIGPDAMFAADTVVRTFDMHAIVDLDTLAQVNEPADVVLGAHVWVGARATVMCCRVGAGSVVAAGAFQRTDQPARSIAAGTPARVIKEGRSWLRPWKAEPAQVRALAAELARWTPEHQAAAPAPARHGEPA